LEEEEQMNEITKVLGRCIAKNDEHKSHPQNLPDNEKTSTELSELEARTKRRLTYSLVRLEASVLLLEISFLLLSLLERFRTAQPTRKIETVADLEDSLRGSPKARVSP
jgi:hypothetical protein